MLFIFSMFLSLILFFTGILGFVLNRKNVILVLISIGIMLLAIIFLIAIHNYGYVLLPISLGLYELLENGSDFFTLHGIFLDNNYPEKQPPLEFASDSMHLFAENKDNFMDLDSSSSGGSKLEQALDSHKKSNPDTGGSKSSVLPQTEFEKKPYIEDKSLPKSISDSNSLGKEINR